MQMQGRVMDGQYINAPFIAGNAPILACLKTYGEDNLLDLSQVSDKFWWPVQWDPGHWLDKVFSRSREMPFVTNTFAQQRFMSSSYLSLKNLADSLGTYIETFKDHDNRMDVGYRLYGHFVVDLLGLLDMLWPLVVLMLEGQSQWCPGWKFTHYVPKARKQLRNIISEIEKVKPSTTICPRLGARLQEVKNFRYGKSELVEGWLVVQDETGKPVNWAAREVPDVLVI